MTVYATALLGEVLMQVADPVRVYPDETYETAGILNRGRGLFKRPSFQGSETKYPRYNRIHAGQFVFSKLFAWEGAVATVTPEFDGMLVSNEFPTFTIIEDRADPGYISYIAQWPGLHGLLSKNTSGMGSRRQRVNVDQLLSVNIPLPELIEQQRIAARLDYLLRRFDAVLDLRSRASSLCTSLRESLIDSAVNEAPESVRVEQVAALERTPVSVDEDALYKVIGARSFGKGIIYYPETRGADVSKLNYFKLPSDALLLSNIKAWEGAIAVTDRRVADDYIASSRFLSYVPVEDQVNTSYLRHYFLSRTGLAQISKASPGAADRNRTLGRQRFEALQIPLPPRVEQDRIAGILDSLSNRIKQAASGPALEALRPAILNAAFTGRL